MPYGVTPCDCIFRYRNMQARQDERGDCTVKSLTCESEPLMQEKFRLSVSAPFSAVIMSSSLDVMKATLTSADYVVRR